MADRVPRRIGVGLLVGFGVVGLVLPVADAASGGFSSSLDLLGLLAPLVEAAAIWAVAGWLWRRGFSGGDLLLVAGWCLGIGVFAAAITLAAVLAQGATGGRIVGAWLLVNDIGVIGGLLGTVVGYFHAAARREVRRQADAHATIGKQKGRLLFLNRLLRHDIRNDITVIRGYTELLADAYPEADELDVIRRKTEEIEHLTLVARDMSESAEELDIEPTAVEPSLAEAIAQVRDAFPEARFDAEIADLRGVTVAATDLLDAVFANLLRNAVQHNDKPTPTVVVRGAVDGNTVRVRIADNGPGIPEAIRLRLFEPGLKGEASSGMGLGLYLVETLVTGFGGDIWFEASTEAGATVVVELDRLPAE